MFSPPLLKIQKFKLHVNYMHVFSVLQYFQFLFPRLYTSLFSLSISLIVILNTCIFLYSIKTLTFIFLLV
ncbi:hypothetical protein COL93_11730 [Bacillus toyonensis]|uniref:Uncharacterized protein n=1 Tax=Bacillus toyonensis TaxID=155322 RepID=A0A2C4QNN5_9BACI|nr:hypothetical protein COL93_11730 [Bacillus toyonensis]PHD66131.1 hypothetical protein COF40_21680 [Bacillus toyonensis]